MAPEAVPHVVVSEEPEPRTLVKEFGNIPIVTSVTKKVTTTHETLCNVVPLYNWLTATALTTTKKVAQRAEEYEVVKTSVLKAEELGLNVVDNLKKSCPVIEKPTDEVVHRTSVYVKQKIQLGKCRVASYSITRATCRATEAVIRTAEVACDSLRSEKSEGVISWLIPSPVKIIYDYTLRPILSNTSRHLRNGRRTIRALRRSGELQIAIENRIRRRRKVSPRKTGKEQPTGLWAWFTSVFSIFGVSPSDISVLPAIPKLDSELTAADPLSSTEDKKRKLSEVETEDASSVEEMSLMDMLKDNIDEYCSDEDPDYSPSDTSTDSLEYRSTDHEESEAPFTEDDFKDEPTKPRGTPKPDDPSQSNPDRAQESAPKGP